MMPKTNSRLLMSSALALLVALLLAACSVFPKIFPGEEEIPMSMILTSSASLLSSASSPRVT